MKILYFSDGGYYSVWVENEQGAKIAEFPCSSETYKKAIKYANIFVKALSI